MTDDSVQKLYAEDKLLARAMDNPSVAITNNGAAVDFSIWAEEVDSLKKEGLSCVSSTLLVHGEQIPTYKNIGFLVNSDATEIVHVADSDSGSNGSGDNFIANPTDLSTLKELASRTREQKLTDMNEVNVNIPTKEAYVGLFFNKALSERSKAQILLAQECHKDLTGQTLPIFEYDFKKSTLTEYNPSKEERNEFLKRMVEEKNIKSSNIHYAFNTEDSHESKRFDVLKPANDEDNNKKNALSTEERLSNLRNRLQKNKSDGIPSAPYQNKNSFNPADKDKLRPIFSKTRSSNMPQSSGR